MFFAKPTAFVTVLLALSIIIPLRLAASESEVAPAAPDSEVAPVVASDGDGVPVDSVAPEPIQAVSAEDDSAGDVNPPEEGKDDAAAAPADESVSEDADKGSKKSASKSKKKGDKSQKSAAKGKKKGSDDEDDKKKDPNRVEWLPFPVVGGNTDMGILLGAQLMLAKFKEGYTPYRFRTHTQISLSFKGGEKGVQIPVHMDFVKLDFPGLAGGKLRLGLGFHYDQVNNSGYFGVGNKAPYLRSWWDSELNRTVQPVSRTYQYMRQEPKLRVSFRYRLQTNLELALGLRFMWMRITPFEDSKLAADMDGLYGLQDHFGLQFAAGVIYDTRDHEYNPVKGIYVESSLRFSPGMDNNLHYGAFGTDARFFVPILGPQLSFATRLMLDMLFGNVPFYEMARAGAFEPIEFIGGRMGLSGIPEGRYHGKIKVGANLELRSQIFPFRIKKYRGMFGTAFFCNIGRVWADYSGNALLDGNSLGLKVAAGGGLRIQFGETVIIRADLAWAKEARDAGSPVGIYLDAYHPF